MNVRYLKSLVPYLHSKSYNFEELSDWFMILRFRDKVTEIVGEHFTASWTEPIILNYLILTWSVGWIFCVLNETRASWYNNSVELVRVIAFRSSEGSGKKELALWYSCFLSKSIGVRNNKILIKNICCHKSRLNN